jgi:hypothetical protein
MKRFSWLRFDAPERPRSVAVRRGLACERVESRQMLDGSGLLVEIVPNELPLSDESIFFVGPVVSELLIVQPEPVAIKQPLPLANPVDALVPSDPVVIEPMDAEWTPAYEFNPEMPTPLEEPPLFLNAFNGNMIFNSEALVDPAFSPEFGHDPFELPGFEIESLSVGTSRNAVGRFGDAPEASLLPSNNAIEELLSGQATPLFSTAKSPEMEPSVQPLVDNVSASSSGMSPARLAPSGPSEAASQSSVAQSPVSQGLALVPSTENALGQRAEVSTPSSSALSAASHHLLDVLFGSRAEQGLTLPSATTSEQAAATLDRIPLSAESDVAESSHTPELKLNAPTNNTAFVDIGQTFQAAQAIRLSPAAAENLARLRQEAAVADARQLASVATPRPTETTPRRGIIRAFESDQGPERVYSRRAREANPALEIAQVDYQRSFAPGAVTERSFEADAFALSPVNSQRMVAQAEAGRGSFVNATLPVSAHATSSAMHDSSLSDAPAPVSLWQEAWQWLTQQGKTLSYYARRGAAQTGVVVLAAVTVFAYYPRLPDAEESQPRLLRRKKANRVE